MLLNLTNEQIDVICKALYSFYLRAEGTAKQEKIAWDLLVQLKEENRDD